MPARISIVFCILYFVFGSIVQPVWAQGAPPPSPTPLLTDPPAGQPTCDLCGWCNQTVNKVPPPNWDSCNKCLYNIDGTEKQNSFYTVIGCISSTKQGQLPAVLVKSLMTIAFGVVGGIAFLMFLYGASMILTSGGDPLRLESGKDTVTSAIIGLLLVIFSIFLLRTVGYDILQIPGFS